MALKTIELTGIVRNLPDNTVKDGAMQELINLRPKDGALRPVAPKVGVELEPLLVRFIHSVSETIKIYIGESDGYIAYWVMSNDVLVNGPISTGIHTQKDLAFASLHNSLMVSDRINEVTYLLVFDLDHNEYVLFEDFLPEMPNIVFERIHEPGDDVAGETQESSVDVEYGDVEISEYVKMQKNKAEDGYLTGMVLAMCAWELFDGTLVRHSLPDRILASTISINTEYVDNLFPGDNPGWRTTTSFSAYKLQFMINASSDWLAQVQSKYRNIVRSFKIFVTLPKSPELKTIGTVSEKDTHRNVLGMKIKSWNETVTYDVSRLSEYVPDPENEANPYFLLKEYKLSELSAGTFVTIKSDTLDDLSTREQMTVNNFSHHKLYGKRLFSYNDRIFLGDIKNILYRGFPLNSYIGPGPMSETGDSYEVGIEFDIIIGNKQIVTVFSGWESFNYYDSTTHTIAFSIGLQSNSGVDYWGYPDGRAKEARIYVKQGAYMKLFDRVTLKSLQYLNLSYAESYVPLYGSLFPSFLPDGSLTSGKASYYDYNRVQATEINNPFYFPAINSYRIGLGRILGMSSNAIALSQGQFGQFPIYCFTTDGIWTMSIGNGETLISNVSPLSREVCSNPDTITPIDGGTVFVTALGLFIISGTQVIEISENAEGNHISRITGTVNYEAIANNPNLYQIKDYLCSTSFLNYLSSAKIGYDYILKEIFVSNNSYKYSWVYSLKYKTWFKLSVVFDTFIFDFPKCYGYRNVITAGDGYTADSTEIDASSTEITADSYYPAGSSYTRYDLNREDADDLIPVHMETRPMKLSIYVYKLINRLLVEGFINNNREFPFSVNLFGSPDKFSWYKLNNSNTFGSKKPLLIGRSSFSCKYYILVLGGMVDEDAYFSYLDVDFTDRYNNKLR